VTNTKRAARALCALTEYEILVDPLAAVTDLIADLRHLCARDGISFDRCLEWSKMHFNVECDEERIVAFCLGCKRKFSRAEAGEYGLGEGDQPETCPSCGARIEEDDDDGL
jgi:hypothetical protein